jgi:hypothetical protein
MRRPALVLTGLVVAALSTGGCGSPTASTASPSATQATVAPQPAQTVPAQTAPGQPAPVATSWVMPDLVGSGLQDAQDAIQKLTSYGIAITKSHDATGAGRRQILDRDWKVCDQSVKAGTTITSDTTIDFGAAKLGEAC